MKFVRVITIGFVPGVIGYAILFQLEYLPLLFAQVIGSAILSAILAFIVYLKLGRAKSV